MKCYEMIPTHPDYMVAAKETCPTTGREHVHIYLHYNNRGWITRIVKRFRIHGERCRGTPKMNEQYVKKDGHVIWEEGEIPSKVECKTVAELAVADVNFINPFLYRIKRDMDNKMNGVFLGSNVYKNVKVVYIHGSSGIGKTRKAIELCEDHEFNIVKFSNNFWLGVNEHRVEYAILDDFRDSMMPANELIMFIDYNKHTVNVKGGSRINEYTNIFITSIQSPEVIYMHMSEEPRRQWMRRWTVIDMDLEQVMNQLPP
jgi:hypothetical protein